MKATRYNIAFVILLVLDFFLLLFLADGFSISYKEAYIYFSQNNLLHYLTNFSTLIFGQNNIALRLPFILFYLGSVILLYALSDDYFKRQSHRFGSIVLFMLLPGVNSASLLVNEAILVVFCVLLYLYLFKITLKEHYWLLFLTLFIDNSFAIMYLALFLYSFKKKDIVLGLVSSILFVISMQMYGFDSSGRPKGYFVDTFGAYASIFSPVIFLYFFYAMYRVAIKKLDRDLYWYISFTALAFSLVFSLRQRIYIDDFAPFVVITIPLMVKLFMHTFRVRLPQFRKKHYIFAIFSVSILILNFLLFTINKPLYLFLENPKKHFAYDYHIIKELSLKLKEKNINEVLCSNYALQLRLKFYGIKKGDKFYLGNIKDKTSQKISIKYINHPIGVYYISKI
jgi:4-amino-4-deoxy-L-arabinose transferase-like glycosyltransferase